MVKDKSKILYIFFVFLSLIIFTQGTYDIEAPSFFVPVFIVALIIGVIGVFLFGKDMRLYKNLYFLSYLITISIVFVPVLGVYFEDGNRFYGFPAQWFSYYHISGSVSVELFGFLFNFFIFYFSFRLLKKILSSSS
ncbi:MAG: hypothetical protein ACQEUT_09000 [Bacillota bacterium]